MIKPFSTIKELVKEEEPIEVIFVSGDNSPDELLGYMKDCHGDWLAVQHGARLIRYWKTFEKNWYDNL